jgi:hypothetical protein
MMRLQSWLAEFCKMHEQAHRGSLSDEELAEYLAARNELSRAVLRAQRIVLKPGQAPRQSVRAALALQVTLHLPAGRLQTLTQDVSSGGFSAFVPALQAGAYTVAFALRLAREGTPVEGNVRVVGTHPADSALRVAFAYEGLAPEAIERIELAVFDSLVAQLTAQG